MKNADAIVLHPPGVSCRRVRARQLRPVHHRPVHALTLLIEDTDGAVEVRSFTTRISAVLALEDAKASRIQRLTILEDETPIYSTRRFEDRWREDPLVG